MKNPKEPKALDQLTICCSAVEAGILKRIERGCSFKYHQKYLEDARFNGISYKMPKRIGPYIVHGNNLHPFFAGLLPEGIRLNALIKFTKTSPDDLFSLFAAAGSNVIGDVFVKQDEPGPVLEDMPKLKQIDFYEYFDILLKSNSYSHGEDVFGGVQEKISATMISFPLNIAKANRSYILKLNPKDKSKLVENEYYSMTLAEKCGLTPAKVKIVRDKNKQSGLFVERFDRIWDDEKKIFSMIHQEDACQFLDRYPSEKYRVSMNDIAAAIQEVATAPAITLLKLLRLTCFSYLLGNGDLHGKNISLSTKLGTSFVDITPAYDLLTTYPYGDQKMAIKLDGKDDNLNRKLIIEFGKRFGVSQSAVENMLDILVFRFSKNAHILENVSFKENEKRHLFQMIKKRLDQLINTHS